jgi:ATP-dependent Lhr-like helicase
LRRQIEPVEPDVFLRFLMRHQRVLPQHRWQGVAGLAEAIEQLQGFELSAGVWEDFVLAARVTDYEPSWLDQLAMTGDLAWGRLRPPKRDEEDGPSASGLTRTAPIALVHRSDLGWLLPAGRTPATFAMRANARTVHEALSARGALFLAELRAITGLLPAHLEEALQELAALGLVSADGFGAVRSVIAPDRHNERTRRVGQRMSRAERLRRAGITPKPRGASQLNLLGGNVGLGTGRWSLFPGPVSEPSADERLDRWAWQLLRRYGVVFRDLLTRESAAPAWGELAPLYRRMELRGEIRGGRFVRGVAGEQFATSEAVELLRSLRDAEPSKDWAVVSAGDPLNLIGIITVGSRIPATHANRLALCDGRLIASLIAGRLEFHVDLPAEQLSSVTRALRAGVAAAARPARQQRWMTGPG